MTDDAVTPPDSTPLRLARIVGWGVAYTLFGAYVLMLAHSVVDVLRLVLR